MITAILLQPVVFPPNVGSAHIMHTCLGTCSRGYYSLTASQYGCEAVVCWGLDDMYFGDYNGVMFILKDCLTCGQVELLTNVLFAHKGILEHV